MIAIALPDEWLGGFYSLSIPPALVAAIPACGLSRGDKEGCHLYAVELL